MKPQPKENGHLERTPGTYVCWWGQINTVAFLMFFVFLTSGQDFNRGHILWMCTFLSSVIVDDEHALTRKWMYGSLLHWALNSTALKQTSTDWEISPREQLEVRAARFFLFSLPSPSLLSELSPSIMVSIEVSDLLSLCRQDLIKKTNPTALWQHCTFMTRGTFFDIIHKMN